MERHDALPASLIRTLLDASRDAIRMPGPNLRECILAQATAAGPPFTVIRREEGSWRPIAAGIHAKFLFDDGNACTWLARMEAGAFFPPHDHPGHEECLVLEGSLEADGIRVGAGDYQIAMKGSRHAEVKTSSGCLLLLRTARV